jgi:hypothetical protein
MNPKGDEISQSVREWMREEIKKGPLYIYELGRFFFTASSFMLGLAVTCEKLQPVGIPPLLFSFAMASFFGSILVALRMVIPKVQSFGEEINLYHVYTEHSKRLLVLSLAWFGLWSLGLGCWVAHLYL